MVRIAVDAMGGDYAPQAIVEGIELARENYPDVQFLMFGDEPQIKKYLKNEQNITIVQADDVITMEDEPVRAVKKKKNSSLVMSAQAVKDGEADALFSAGNSGSVMVCGLLIIGRIKGVERPGLTATLPVVDNDTGFTMIDIGANADAKVSNICQYALLGSYYAEKVQGVNNPRVALINNGTEADKGNMSHQDMFKALSEMKNINFIGNVEARTLLQGSTDVAVTDGFTGNAVLKSIEGTGKSIITMLIDSIKNDGLRAKLGGLMLKPVLTKIGKKFDYKKYGGAVLLGVNAPVVKAHGNSKAKQVNNTIGQIKKIVDSGLVNSLTDYFAAENKKD